MRSQPRNDGGDEKEAARARIRHQQTWVDLQIRRAMERGDFDNLPGAGKPLQLDAQHDPDWWLKKLVEREKLTVLPLSVALRREDAELDATLDKLPTEAEVRRHVLDFNKRVVAARYRLPEGPPLVTMPRDVEETVAAWAQRRAERLAARQGVETAQATERHPRKARSGARWWRRQR